MKTWLIVYHSMTDGTRQMAVAAADGAGSEAATVRTTLLHASQAGPADLLGADGYLFATPENLASMAGLMKDFFDRINGRPFATMVCAGSDGRNAARQTDDRWRHLLADTALTRCRPRLRRVPPDG